MHNTSNPEADGLQQKTTPGAAPKNRKRRLQFTLAHQNWTIEDWKNVAWSDEPRFLLQHSDGRVRIWRKEHESMDPSCLVSTVQAAGGGVMVRGIFSWHTFVPIRVMDVQPTNLQQLRDAIMSIWTKISEECFQHLVESIPRRIKAFLKAKGGPTRY